MNFYRLGGQMPTDYCFPHRWESMTVLKRAMEVAPDDARAPYYLGNLLYDHQPEEAVAYWERSRELDDSFPTVHRNLALAWSRDERGIDKAIASMEKAVELNRSDPRLYFELDEIYEKGGISWDKRLKTIRDNYKTVVQRDDALARLISLYIEAGQYDRAIKILTDHHFHKWEGVGRWEGGGEIRTYHVDARLLRGIERRGRKKYSQALSDFHAAYEYPENQEIGKPYHGGREAEISYFTGTAQQLSGQENGAKESFEKAVSREYNAPEIKYFQGLAYRKLGREDKAVEIFDGLIETGRKMLADPPRPDFLIRFEPTRTREEIESRAQFLIGLGLLGKGMKKEAEAEFDRIHGLETSYYSVKVRLAVSG
jgi:tetratricopeptide (TPR) repeat protein